MQQAKSNIAFGQFERKGSSFTWEIVMLNGKVINGHSKPRGQAEAFPQNKLLLLQKIFDRLLIKNDYLKKVQYIKVFRCISDKDEDNIEFFTFFPSEFRLSPFLRSKRDEETQSLRELLRTYYADKTEIYGVKDINDMSQLLSSNPAPKTAEAPQKVKTFDELNAESKTLVFGTYKQADKYFDTLPKYLSSVQKNTIIQNVWANKANAKWVQ